MGSGAGTRPHSRFIDRFELSMQVQIVRRSVHGSHARRMRGAAAVQGAGRRSGGVEERRSVGVLDAVLRSDAGGVSSTIRCSRRCRPRRWRRTTTSAIAVARVRQARAIFDDVALDRYPTVTVGAAVDRRQQAVPGVSDEPVTTSTYRAGFDAFWEIDVFGRVRSAMRAAQASAESEDATLEDVRVSVAAEVARNYFELRGLQQQLAVAQRSLVNQQETLRLTRVRRDAGVGEEQDVASAAARVAAVEASVPPIESAIAERQHRLAVLTGVRPGATHRRSLAARVSAARQGAGARRSGKPAASSARCACSRAPAGGGGGARGCRGGRALSAHHGDRRPGVSRRAGQPLRRRRTRETGR